MNQHDAAALGKLLAESGKYAPKPAEHGHNNSHEIDLDDDPYSDVPPPDEPPDIEDHHGEDHTDDPGPTGPSDVKDESPNRTSANVENDSDTKKSTASGSGQEKAETDLPRLWNATDLEPATQPRWLARKRLPRAAVSLLCGEEGIGKSVLWVWIAAAITRGKPLPEFGIPPREPERVLLAGLTEDDWSV